MNRTHSARRVRRAHRSALAARRAARRRRKLKVGFMLPYTGTYAALGNAIENGFKLYVAEQGGKLGGREIEFFKVDDESRAVEGHRQRQQADQARQRRRASSAPCIRAWRWRWPRPRKDNGTLLIIPNAGADAVDRADVRARTSSAARSRTGSRATRWARSRRSKGAKKAVTHHLEIRGRRRVRRAASRRRSRRAAARS